MTTTTTTTTTTTLVLGIDVERLGQNPQVHSTIQLGAAVLDQRKSVLDRFLYSEYRSEPEYERDFVKEDVCMKEFWNKFPDILKSIEDDTDKSVSVQVSRKRMIVGFVAFIRKWEGIAQDQRATLVITMDNKIGDASTINALITQYCDVDHPIMPFSFHHPNKYLKMYETTSMMWGMLMASSASQSKNMDPYDGQRRNCEKTFTDWFQVDTSSLPPHTHNADDDAAECAWYMQTCLELARRVAK
jgi:hypothetical protein